MKNNLDECQELKLLKIEHYGCWFAFWGLIVAIFIQMVFGNMEFENIIGEFIVLMSLSAYIVVACLKEGIWDRKLKPNFKTNLFVSTIGAFVSGIVWFIVFYRDFQNLKVSIGTTILVFVLTEVVCLLLLTIASKVYKKRVHQLEDANE